MGEQLYTTAGTHSFTVPADVTKISFVVVAGGGGGSSGILGGGSGAALAWVSDLLVTPGEILTIMVGAGGARRRSGGASLVSLRAGVSQISIVAGGGLGATRPNSYTPGGTVSTDFAGAENIKNGGGTGGAGGNVGNFSACGAGGAAGFNGPGGRGANGNPGAINGDAGDGVGINSGGGGGSRERAQPGAGRNRGGRGAIARVPPSSTRTTNTGGGGGGAWIGAREAAGVADAPRIVTESIGGLGGVFGGGGGSNGTSQRGGDGGDGAALIVWGDRDFSAIGPLTWGPPESISGAIGIPVDLSFGAVVTDGGDPVFTATGLPAGLAISAAGQITGTAAEIVEQEFTLTATTVNGSATRIYLFSVLVNPNALPAPILSDGGPMLSSGSVISGKFIELQPVKSVGFRGVNYEAIRYDITEVVKNDTQEINETADLFDASASYIVKTGTIKLTIVDRENRWISLFDAGVAAKIYYRVDAAVVWTGQVAKLSENHQRREITLTTRDSLEELRGIQVFGTGNFREGGVVRTSIRDLITRLAPDFAIVGDNAATWADQMIYPPAENTSLLDWLGLVLGLLPSGRFFLRVFNNEISAVQLAPVEPVMPSETLFDGGNVFGSWGAGRPIIKSGLISEGFSATSLREQVYNQATIKSRGVADDGQTISVRPTIADTLLRGRIIDSISKNSLRPIVLTAPHLSRSESLVAGLNILRYNTYLRRRVKFDYFGIDPLYRVGDVIILQLDPYTDGRQDLTGYYRVSSRSANFSKNLQRLTGDELFLNSEGRYE